MLKTATGDHSFNIEVMVSEEERALGLMFRRSLPENSGMLFLYDPPQPATMWMKNTLIPLDMIFITSDGRIAGIRANTTPLSTASVGVGQPTRFVLEVPGGYAARRGIAPGDQIELLEIPSH